VSSSVRRAVEADVDAIVALAEIERAVQHANRASAVWRKAADSADVIRTNSLAGFAQEHMMLRVHESDGSVDGYVVAAMVDGEAVYDAGGRLCLVTDFVLADGAAWLTTGRALLAESTAEAGRRGAVAAFAGCADYDHGKRALLDELGYGPGWGYRTRDLAGSDGTRTASSVRPMLVADLDAAVDLAEGERGEQDKHRSSTIWRKAADSADRYRAELAELLGQEQMLMRVHETGGTVDGYVRAALYPKGPPVWDPGGPVLFVTEFVLRDPAAWPTVGAALLASVAAEASRRGAVAALVQYAHYAAGKQEMLAGLDYGPAWGYLTRDLV
jgi:hypothetical protein